MISSGYTDVGRVREVNQDSFIVVDLLGLYIVADGMGGHAAGEKASITAIGTALDIFSSYDFENQKIVGSDETLSIIDMIRISFKEANNRIIKESISSVHLQGMGTTQVMSIIYNNKAYLGSIGDSRIYKITSSSIEQLTRDHSVVQDLMDQGLITSEEAKVHPYKNVITKCLGMQAEIEIDTKEINLEKDDKLLLCTDGLTGLVTDEEIKNIVNSNNDLNNVVKKLVNLANERGGHDNITVVIIHNN
ncbi:MAG: protein-serine/threonine phosphatase [Candidatus Sericytochromatia bacterium]|nr:MAG: protein-serine/threonine phosphatase [Candidatus Sericytochromatia bacterium]